MEMIKIPKEAAAIIEEFIIAKKSLLPSSSWEENFQLEGKFFSKIIPYLSNDFRLSLVYGESTLSPEVVVELDAYRMSKEKSHYVSDNRHRKGLRGEREGSALSDYFSFNASSTIFMVVGVGMHFDAG